MNSNNHKTRFFSDNGRPIRVLRFVHEYTIQHKQSPTIREACEGCGVPSTSTMNYYVDELIKFGCLEEPERMLDGHAKSRFLRLTEIGLNNIGLETAVCQSCEQPHTRKLLDKKLSSDSDKE